MRRYDIDWLRVIAIGLLLIYHVAIGFQPWGMMIGFITNKESWPGLWLPMAALNVWRIPLLFFVSGMGVYFAIQQRNWKQLITERMLRIWLPFVFGMFAIVPLHILIWNHYYNMELSYVYSPGHLWFLANIFAYVILLCPLLFYMKRNERARHVIRKIFSHPLGLVMMIGTFIAEAYIINPIPYELYAMTRHGFALGMLGFFFGFCFVLSGTAFWHMIQAWRWAFIALAITGFAFRQFYFGLAPPTYLLVSESQMWILAVLAFGSKHLNKPGRVLTYLSQAAYPVYIWHMVFLYAGSAFIFPLDISVQLKFALILLFTVTGCFVTFEIIRRVPWVRVLFGLRTSEEQTSK